VPVELLELLGAKLLVKQQWLPLQILDLSTGERRAVAAEPFGAPSAFVHLHLHERFLTFRQAKVRSLAAGRGRGEGAGGMWLYTRTRTGGS
jgi:hypothetical protein